MNMKYLAITATVISVACLYGCQEAPNSRAFAQIRPEKIEAHLEFLADDAMRGRETASRGLLISENYVATQFGSYGLEPGGEAGTYFQTVPLRQSVNDPSKSKVHLQIGDEIVSLTPNEEFLVSPSVVSEGSSVTAPVVFVGAGIYAPEKGIDNYADINANGKIVAHLNGRSETYKTLDPHIYLRPPTVAEQHGAIGTISLSTPETKNALKPRGRPATSWLDSNGEASTRTLYTYGPEIRAILSASASTRIFEGVEESFTDIAAAVRADEASFRGMELPVTATIMQKSSHRNASSRNVLGILRGSDPQLSNDFIVITCHLDHIGIGDEVDGDNIYNGAMDNATGVAMMLEIARAMSMDPNRPKRSVLFYATTAEEHGLVGSHYFVNNPTVPLENIVANINIDLPYMFYPFDEVTAFGAEHSNLRSFIRTAVGGLGYKLDEATPFERGASDHFSFLQAGVPGMRFIPALRSTDPSVDVDALREKYRAHVPTDDLSLPFDYEIGAQFANIVMAVVTEIGNADEGPKMLEDDPLSTN